jgi:cell division FtsZ-interacting protein ZapD
MKSGMKTRHYQTKWTNLIENEQQLFFLVQGGTCSFDLPFMGIKSLLQASAGKPATLSH